MNKKEFFKKIEETNNFNKKIIKENKERLIKSVNCAESGIIIASDCSLAMIGSKVTIQTILTNAFYHWMKEGNFTKEELIEMVEIATDLTSKTNSKSSKNNHRKEIDELRSMLDTLKKLINKLDEE